MPRTYVRKTNRQSWNQESMKNAIAEVMSGTMGYKKASKTFNIPQSTLDDRVRKARKEGLSSTEASAKGGMGKYKKISQNNKKRN